MMMSVVKKEPKYHIYGFSNELVKLDIHDGMSLNNVLDETRNKTYGSTDCSLPMVHALENKLDVDCFVVITDNETYMGKVHPSQALANYREKMGKPNAKLIVLAVTATDFSIADPSDPGMLDIAGFDAAVPTVISEFVKMG
jgi:60 kDa SS-A/Ro ribonucleoprotein